MFVLFSFFERCVHQRPRFTVLRRVHHWDLLTRFVHLFLYGIRLRKEEE